MKTIILVSVAALIFTVGFIISLDWAIDFEYGSSYYPVAITFFLGVFALGSLGGIFGAVLDYKEAN